MIFTDKLYVIGGSDGQTSMMSTEIFDMLTSTWHVGPSLCTPRANMGVAVIGRRIFAVGGFSGKAFLNTIEYLCDDSDEWCVYQPNADLDSDSSSILSTSDSNHHLSTVAENGLTCNMAPSKSWSIDWNDSNSLIDDQDGVSSGQSDELNDHDGVSTGQSDDDCVSLKHLNNGQFPNDNQLPTEKEIDKANFSDNGLNFQAGDELIVYDSPMME